MTPHKLTHTPKRVCVYVHTHTHAQIHAWAAADTCSHTHTHTGTRCTHAHLQPLSCTHAHTWSLCAHAHPQVTRPSREKAAQAPCPALRPRCRLRLLLPRNGVNSTICCRLLELPSGSARLTLCWLSRRIQAMLAILRTTWGDRETPALWTRMRLMVRITREGSCPNWGPFFLAGWGN